MQTAVGLALALASASPPVVPPDIVIPNRKEREEAPVTLSTAQTFAAVDLLLHDRRTGDAEILLRALTSDPLLSVRSEARFRLGKLHAERGDYRGAATLYQALLDEEPSAGAVRLELARIYARLGETAAAARELRRAQAGHLPIEVARSVDRISTALRNSAPVGFDLSLGLAPDTNINRATASRTIDAQGIVLTVDRDGRATSGIGLTIGAQGFARLPLTPKVGLLVEITGAASLYPSGRYDDIAAAIAVGPEIRRSHTRIRPAVVVGRRYFDRDRLYDQIGAAIEVRRDIGRTAQLSTAATVSRLTYPSRPFLTGATYIISADLEKALTPQLFILGGISASRTDAKDPAYATRTIGARLIVSRDLGRITLFGGSSYSHLQADAPFGLFDKTRRDEYADAQIGLSARFLAIKGLVPSARLQVSRNKSTIGLYDFKRTRLEVSLSRQF